MIVGTKKQALKVIVTLTKKEQQDPKVKNGCFGRTYLELQRLKDLGCPALSLPKKKNISKAPRNETEN